MVTIHLHTLKHSYTWLRKHLQYLHLKTRTPLGVNYNLDCGVQKHENTGLSNARDLHLEEIRATTHSSRSHHNNTCRPSVTCGL